MYTEEEGNSMMNTAAVEQRPRQFRVHIEYLGETYYHHIIGGSPDRVTRPTVKMKRDLISVGCTDVTPDTLRELLKTYDANFKVEEKEVVIQ